MARPYTAFELVSELQSWVKRPTDPDLRKLIRRTIQTLEAFKDLVGELEAPEPQTELLPSLPTRIKDSE